MTDQSHLDNRYFIDKHIYNCPFCKRRHVTYRLKSAQTFNWTEDKVCTVILAKCGSCEMESMHLTFNDITTTMGTARLRAGDGRTSRRRALSVRLRSSPGFEIPSIL